MKNEFVVPLSDQDRIGVELDVDRGQVVGFAIRYDIFVDERWYNVAVFDAHTGNPHWHLNDPIRGKGDRREIPLDLKNAVTYAFNTIRAQWEQWREQFIRRMQGHEQQENLF